jgi:hypothetical protein
MRLLVNPFLKHAEELFATAQRGGAEDCELAILIAGDGAIRILESRGWELEPLRLFHGAREAYRVSRTADQVRLEARASGESCLLETNRPGRCLGGALADFPRYLTA